ncbi:MAG TPA: septum formation initiator family protein [Myxococcaceae bacterium]
MLRGKAIKWAAGVAAALVMLSLMDSGGFRRRRALQRDLQDLEERNRGLRERNQALLEEIELLRSDPAAIERAAREELGFVRPGELVFTVGGE